MPAAPDPKEPMADAQPQPEDTLEIMQGGTLQVMYDPASNRPVIAVNGQAYVLSVATAEGIAQGLQLAVAQARSEVERRRYTAGLN